MYDGKLSWRHTLIKSSRAISHIKWFKLSDVSETVSVRIIKVISGTNQTNQKAN
jgi:hypothetical protein